MKAKLVKVGKSFCVRLSPAMIKAAGFQGQVVDVVVDDGEIILRTGGRRKGPRAGWEKAIRQAIAEHGDEYTEEDIEWLNAPGGPIPDKDA
jgi:antitoxin component of MazEF toxin-antitoxin module